MNMLLIRDVKGTISAFQELTENRTKREGTHRLEHPKQENPSMDLILQGEPSLRWQSSFLEEVTCKLSFKLHIRARFALSFKGIPLDPNKEVLNTKRNRID